MRNDKEKRGVAEGDVGTGAQRLTGKVSLAAGGSVKGAGRIHGRTVEQIAIIRIAIAAPAGAESPGRESPDEKQQRRFHALYSNAKRVEKQDKSPHKKSKMSLRAKKCLPSPLLCRIMRAQSCCTDGEHSSVVEPRIVVPVVVGSIPTAHPRKKGHTSQEGCPFSSYTCGCGDRSHDKRRLSWARTCSACPRPFARETPLAGQSAQQTEGGGPGGGSPLLTLEKKGTLRKKGALFHHSP